MTDSELRERLDSVVGQLREAIEERGALLELDMKPDLRWAGVARMPSGKLLISTQKTGRQPTPESKKPVLEAVADLTMEGRFLGRVLIYAGATEVELPGGARKPLDHASVAKVFSAM